MGVLVEQTGWNGNLKGACTKVGVRQILKNHYTELQK